MHDYQLSLYEIYFLLVAGHFFADFALQNDYLARAKNRHMPEGKNGIWCIAMTAHAFMHGGVVFLITGSLTLALIEVVLHGWIDTMKCEGHLTYKHDQYLHVICKVMYVLIIALGFTK